MVSSSSFVMGIDCSTTGCKAVVWDQQGKAVAQGRAATPILRPQPGWHEQDAAGWWQAFCQASRQALASIRPAQVEGLCLSIQRETFVPVNAHGQPLRGAILWMDERARPLLPGLEQAIGSAEYHRITGKPLSRNLAVGKIAWLRQHEPDIFNQTAKYLDVFALLAWRLTGQYATGWGCADPLGLFDMPRQDWSDQVLALIGTRRDQMPEAFPPGAVIGRVTNAAAQETGLPRGAAVVAGLGDGQASGLGAGVIEPGVAYISLGTSVVSGIVSDQYLTDRAFRTLFSGMACAREGLAHRAYFLETAILAGNYIVDWYLDDFLGAQAGPPGTASAVQRETWDAAAAQIPPGAEGLVVVPYWNSVLNPYWDPAASGIVVGWKGHHRRAHLYRAILEGILFEQHLATTCVEQAAGQSVTHYLAVGGGARSALWRQMLSDITGKPVYLAQTPGVQPPGMQAPAAPIESAALGAGILAACGAGWFDTPAQAVQAMVPAPARCAEPDPERFALYQEIYQRVYRHLFPALQPYLDQLASVRQAVDQR